MKSVTDFKTGLEVKKYIYVCAYIDPASEGGLNISVMDLCMFN